MELTVCAAGNGDFREIADAVAAAPLKGGGIIQIRPGEYRRPVVLDRPVCLVGDPQHPPTLRCEQAICLDLQTTRGEVHHLILHGRGERPTLSPPHAFMGWFYRSPWELLSQNQSLACVRVHQGHLVLTACEVSNRRQGYGIEVRGKTAEITLQKTAIRHGMRGSGLFLGENSQGVLKDCEMVGHQADAVVVRQARLYMMGCDLFENGGVGLRLLARAQGDLLNCQIHHNRLCNISVETASRLILTKSYIYSGGQPPTTVGGSIALGCGGLSFSKKAKGQVNHCEIFDNAVANVAVGFEATPVFIDSRIRNGQGFGIAFERGGRGVLERCEIYGNAQANVLITSQSTPQVVDCHIYDGEDEGVKCFNRGQGVFDGCRIYRNRVANVSLRTASHPTFNNSHIYDGHRNGVVINGRSNGVFRSCQIYKNQNLNVFVLGESSPYFVDSHIYDGGQAGMVFKKKGGGLVECCYVRNHPQANVYLRDSANPTFIQSAICNGQHAGVVVTYVGKGVFKNCRIFDNGSNGVMLWGWNGIRHTGGEFWDCKIYGNRANGVCLSGWRGTRLLKCHIYENQETGLLATDGSVVVLDGCYVQKNQLAGVEVSELSQATLEQCHISEGRTAGVLAIHGGQAILKACQIQQNRFVGAEAKDGGRLLVEGGVIDGNQGLALRFWRRGGGVCRCEQKADYGDPQRVEEDAAKVL